MPVVEIHLLEGYGPEEKARLGRALTDAVRFVVPAAPEAITVMMHEMPASDYFRGGERRKGASALPDPAGMVREYLGAMERREIERARGLLGEGFVMVFPGSAPMTRIEELLAWAAPRYRFVTKSYHSFEAFQGETSAVVYCRGTLQGEWPDGTAFSGIRFVDRFEIAHGRIVRQDVWNDMGETRPRP